MVGQSQHVRKPGIPRLPFLIVQVSTAALMLTPLSPLAGRIDTTAAPGHRFAVQQVNLSALIDGLQSKYSRMQGLAADFTQLYLGGDGRSATESGRLLLKRPGKARWDYLQPERKIFVSDGKNIFFYVYGERQATQTTIKESADPQIPFLFLLGRGNLRRDFSRIEVVDNERASIPGNIVLKLVPKRAPEEFKELLVEVSPGSIDVRRMVIFERNGARMDFILSNVRENAVAPDSEFQFVPPTGTAIRKAQP